MWTIEDVLQGTQGRLFGKVSGDSLFSGFSIDSRTIDRGELFIALSGPNFDGHNYVERAVQCGGKGAIVSGAAFEERQSHWTSLKSEAFFIVVGDPLRAMQSLARWYRKRFSLPLIGVSGSNGKTTTKEMIGAILSQGGHVLKNEGNLNNHIGLPLSLLRLGTEHSVAVLEMGISGKDEMSLLCDIACPTIGLITNIGSAHLEGLGSLEGVAREKGVLFENVSDEGLAVINRDDPHLKVWEGRLPESWTFGLDPSADMTAQNIVKKEGKTCFTLSKNRGGEAIDGLSLSLPGLHQVQNALAAAATASAIGVELREVFEGLKGFKALPQRTEMINKKGITVLFDAYNANPDSVAAALNLLSETAVRGRRVALLGEMLELGQSSREAHFEIGRKVAELGIDSLTALGPSSEVIAEGALSAGMEAEHVFTACDIETAAIRLKETLSVGDLLLMKASRGMQLERLLEKL